MFKTTRLHFLMVALITIGLGLLSRTKITPPIVYPFAGDTLYATMVYFFVAFLIPKNALFKTALLTLLICCCIEVSQLIDVAWLNHLRSFKMGRLILGQGFLWSDLVCYALGTAIGAGIQKLFFVSQKS